MASSEEASPDVGAFQVGAAARWGAISHRIVGRLAWIEVQLNLVLALETGRDVWSVRRALKTFEFVGIDERRRLLNEIDPLDDGLPQTTSAWIGDLADVRNRLAHGWMVTASRESATFRSFRRSRYKQFTLTQDDVTRHLRKTDRVERNLMWLQTMVGDPLVWGELMGFDARN